MKALLLLLLVPLLPALAGAPAGKQDRAVELRSRIDALVERRLPSGAQAGILVVDLSTGRELYARNAAETFIPASNTKLFTTAAVLCRLDREARFQTWLYVIDGVLHVVGGGDPTLTEEDFETWADALRARGVARISDIVLHDTRGDTTEIHPDWSRYTTGAPWKAPVSWFSLNDNCVEATLLPASKAGGRPTVRLSPDTRYVTVINRATTVEKVARGKDAVFSVRPGGNTIVFSRQVGLKARPPTWSIAIRDPTMYFGTVLSETLKRKEIRVTGTIKRRSDPVRRHRPIVVHSTDPRGTIRFTNTHSQNLYAELLARHVAVASGRPATFEEAGKAITAFARSIGARDSTLVDGSGLSRNNHTSPRDMVALLRHMHDHPQGEAFFGSLAVSGAKEGTLRKRMKGPDMRGRVHAKTGTISGVDALSGYVEKDGGGRIAFSMLLNRQKSHADARALMDAICAALVEY